MSDHPNPTTCGVLIATGLPSFDALCGGSSPWRLPLGGRTIVDHWMRRFAEAGVCEVHVILCDDAPALGDLLGDGGRWGVRVRRHLVAEVSAASSAFARLDVSGDVLLADCRTYCGATAWQTLVEEDRPRTLVDRQRKGSGVARLGGEGLRAIANVRRGDLPSTLSRRLATTEDDGTLDLSSPASLLAAQQTLFRADDLGRQTFATGEKIAVGRNVRIHPTARICEPAVLCDDVTIGANAVVGPYATVGRGSVIDDTATATNAVIAADTYVGSGLSVDEAVVCGDRLSSVASGTTVTVADRLLLDGIGRRGLRRRIGAAVMTVIAAILWLVTRPLCLLPAVFRGPVRGPRSHFFRRVVPGLGDVLTGRLRLVGQASQVRGGDGWSPLPGRLGLIDELTAAGGRTGSPLQTAAADAFYAATASTRTDFRLLGRYAWRVVCG